MIQVWRSEVQWVIQNKQKWLCCEWTLECNYCTTSILTNVFCLFVLHATSLNGNSSCTVGDGWARNVGVDQTLSKTCIWRGLADAYENECNISKICWKYNWIHVKIMQWLLYRTVTNKYFLDIIHIVRLLFVVSFKKLLITGHVAITTEVLESILVKIVLTILSVVFFFIILNYQIPQALLYQNQPPQIKIFTIIGTNNYITGPQCNLW